MAGWSSVEAAGLPITQSIALVTLGGMAATFAAWFGFGAVTWAMTRVVRARAGFMRVLLAVSAAAWPLWLAAPAGAMVLKEHCAASARAVAWAVVATGALLFAAQLAAVLRAAAAISIRQAWACVALSGVLCLSFLSLHR